MKNRIYQHSITLTILISLSCTVLAQEHLKVPGTYPDESVENMARELCYCAVDINRNGDIFVLVNYLEEELMLRTHERIDVLGHDIEDGEEDSDFYKSLTSSDKKMMIQLWWKENYDKIICDYRVGHGLNGEASLLGVLAWIASKDLNGHDEWYYPFENILKRCHLDLNIPVKTRGFKKPVTVMEWINFKLGGQYVTEYTKENLREMGRMYNKYGALPLLDESK
jgi:hypothetical protein